ncbi:MAG: hypothetical protein EPN33_13040 [Acidobacteria bacterium]|nr:MAG: hypothetical protein EPN33_13040 [Acidobacteriota bacterium]
MPLTPMQRDLFGRPSAKPALHTCREAIAPGTAWRRALRRRWGTLAAIMALVLAAGVAFQICARPQYQAEASVEPQVSPQAKPEMASLLPLPSTTAQELAARSVVAGAAQALRPQAAGLLPAPVRYPAWLARHWPLPPSRAERVAALRRHLRVASLPDSQVIQLSFTAPSPQLATAFVQQMIAAYDRRKAAEARSAALERVQFLSEQAGQARAAVVAATQEVTAVARQQGLSDPAHQMQVASQRWQQLAAAETSGEIAALQQTATIAQHASSGAADSSYATQGVPKDLLAQRATLAAEVEKLGEKYRPQALPLRQTRQQLASLDASLAALRREHREREHQALAAVEQQLHGLRAALARQRGTQMQLRTELARFDLAQRSLTARQQVYSGVLEQLQQAANAVGAAPPALLVSDPAAALPQPVSPRLASTLAAALLLGLALGLSAVWWQDRTDDRLRFPEAEEMGVPVADVLPRRSRHLDLRAAVAPVAQRCTTSLLLAQNESGVAIALVTSTGAGEGKSDLALEMAAQLAQQVPSVLLLDAHCARPALHERFHATVAPGLSELLTGQASVESVLHAEGNLHFIAAGRRSEVCLPLAAGAGNDLLRAARARFSWVIIDGPPVLTGPEASLWAALADCTLVVSHYGQTPASQLRRGLDVLEAAGGRNLALVVNRAPAKTCDPARPLWRLEAAAGAETAVMRMRA